MKSIGITMLLVASLYSLIAMQGIYMYGTNIGQSILGNIGKKYSDKVFPEAYVMQFLFLIILACHIPYCFFAGKESLLIIIDEIMRNSLSYTLSKKLLANKHYKNIEEDPLEAQKESLTIPNHHIDRHSKYKPDAEGEIRKSLHQVLDNVNPALRKTVEDSGQELSRMTMQDMTQLAYKSMNPVIYYTVNISIYVSQAVLGIVLSDIGLVFGFIGTFAGTGLCFFLPSWFFISGYNKFANEEFKRSNKLKLTVAYINFLLGIGAFGIFFYNNILSIKDAKKN